jgi:hypothetical protein
MMRRTPLLVSGLLLAVTTGNPSTGFPQGRRLTISEVRTIFASGGDVVGWDEFDVPEFIAAVYGSRATAAIVEILREPSTQDNYYFQLEALTAAQYGRVAIPTPLVMEYATGQRGGNVGGVLQHRATMALAQRPDPALVTFWLELERSKDASFRQLAAAGIACALGSEAVPHLSRMRTDSTKAVAQVAEFYLTGYARGRGTAKWCGGTATREEASQTPVHVRSDLLERGRPILEKVP